MLEIIKIIAIMCSTASPPNYSYSRGVITQCRINMITCVREHPKSMHGDFSEALTDCDEKINTK